VPAPERHARTARSLPVFAALVSLAFVSVAGVPHASSQTLDDPAAAAVAAPVQEFVVSDAVESRVERDGYDVTDPPPPAAATAPVVGTPDPGSAQAPMSSSLPAVGRRRSAVKLHFSTPRVLGVLE